MTSLLALVTESSQNPVAELCGKFGVNWPFFIASCLNFVLVIWVLKKFAFGPIQQMLEQRRERIAEGENKLKLIEKQLAESEQTTTAAIAKASEEAVRMINEAKLEDKDLEKDKADDPRFKMTPEQLKAKGITDFQLYYAVQTIEHTGARFAARSR